MKAQQTSPQRKQGEADPSLTRRVCVPLLALRACGSLAGGSGTPEHTSDIASRVRNRGIPAAVLALAVGAAALLYGQFRGVDRSLWDDPVHDHNAHYLYCLRLATDLRHGDLLRFADHLNQACVWPPLLSLLAAGTVFVGGLDYRLAVLPSLAGWVGTVVLAFLAARRAAGRGGNLAGAVAALFVAASPAHRAYATDVMLESLGACLSLVVLYAYLRTAQADGRREGRLLGVALTLLFLEKYNYWFLLVLALAAAQVVSRPLNPWLRRVRELVSVANARRWLAAEVRRPLGWASLLVLGLTLVVSVRGPQPLVLGGRSLSLYPPHNLIHLAYVVLFVRAVLWWRRSGRAWVDGRGGALREVARWHCWPAAAWLLLPRHPSFFLWYLSPANADAGQRFAVLDAARDYFRWLGEDYHLGVAATCLAAGLCAVGLLSWRRLRPGGAAVPCLVALAVGLTLVHPNHKGRCVHSWVAVCWVMAGVGAASLIHGRLTARCRAARPWLATAAVGSLLIFMGPALLAPGHALEGGPHTQHASLIDVTDSYVPDVAGARKATVLAAVPFRTLTQWALLQRAGDLAALDEHWYDFGADSPTEREAFLGWLQKTDCDTLVFLERLPGPFPWVLGPECDRHAGLLPLLRQQTFFHRTREQEFPRQHCRVIVWRRAAAGPLQGFSLSR
jgi:hypothetical protein